MTFPNAIEALAYAVKNPGVRVTPRNANEDYYYYVVPMPLEPGWIVDEELEPMEAYTGMLIDEETGEAIPWQTVEGE